MKKYVVLFLFAAVYGTGCSTEQENPPVIHYDVRFPNAVHNEADITLTLRNIGEGPVTISMSRTSPGRYALHEFAKNVYSVTAVDGEEDELRIRRAGLIDNEKYANDWTGTLNYVLNSPGNSFYNPVEMSMQAPFVDAATSVDAQNKSNTFISYYSWGAVIGLGLDLLLRTNFEHLTLDDYMRRMWYKYGKKEVPYEIEDLQQTLAEVTDSTEFADYFFESYIQSGNHIDLAPLLEKAGFILQKMNPGSAVLVYDESVLDYESGVLTISGNTKIGSPLYKGGLDKGDIIRSVEGQTIRNARQMNRLLASHSPGDKVVIQYESLGEPYESSVELAEDQTFELLTFEQAGKEVTEEIKAFRESWIESKSNLEL